MNADLLILLTDVGGVYDKAPTDPSAKVGYYTGVIKAGQ